MKLKKEDFEFNNRQICLMTPRLVNLDTTLINLYMLLRFDGRRPVGKTGRQTVTIDGIVDQLIQNHRDRLKGFSTNRALVRDWIYSDLVNMVNRGIEGREEKVAAPLPLHLNAYKLRNPDNNRDFGSAEQIYSMIRSDTALVQQLTRFLGEGMSAPDYETYDGETPLDLDTMTIVRMVDSRNLVEKAGAAKEPISEPICAGQARLLQHDLRCLLAYQRIVPRSALIGYIRAIVGLHLGLYLLRLFRLVTGWVHDGQANDLCINCPVHPNLESNCFRQCPYAFQSNPVGRDMLPQLIVDVGDDPMSAMSELAIQSCSSHYAITQNYMQSMFTINQLINYSKSSSGQRSLGHALDRVEDALAILRNPPTSLEEYFNLRIDGLFSNQSDDDEDDVERPEIAAIRKMKSLSSLEVFVQLITLGKSKLFQPNLIKQLDSFFMKNTETGLIRQGKGKRNPRRWQLSSGLLEVLVQIAVLEPLSTGTFRSRPILIEDFTQWLRERYGLVILPNQPGATIGALKASNDNQKNLTKRLREIGFYTDLSDAYNTQTIRPRYPIESS